MRKYLFCLSFIVCFVACQKKTSIEEFTGKYITNIVKDQIVAADGTTFDLEIGDSTRVFYLIRHAEKDTIKSEDPPLSGVGVKRSEALFDIFRGTKLDNIYSTMYMRTISTVDGVSSGKGMQIKAYSPRDLRALYSTVVDSTDDKRILIVGHSNTTPVLANFISDTKHYTSSFTEDDYDNFIVILDNGKKGKEMIPLKFKP